MKYQFVYLNVVTVYIYIIIIIIYIYIYVCVCVCVPLCTHIYPSLKIRLSKWQVVGFGCLAMAMARRSATETPSRPPFAFQVLG